MLNEHVSFDPDTELLTRGGVPYYHLRLPQEVLDELAAAGFAVLEWTVRPKEAREEAYILGGLLAIGAKPGK